MPENCLLIGGQIKNIDLNIDFNMDLNKGEYPIDGGVLQSEQWKSFQNKVGNKTSKVFDGKNFSALMIFHSLPVVGGYFFIPRGPLVLSDDSLNQNILKMVQVCQEEKVPWLRIEPQTKSDLEKIKKSLGTKFSIKKSKKNHEPAQTLMLDLSLSEEELLSKMKQKTRYNIRLAKKRGVEVLADSPEKSLEEFLALNKDTAKRDKVEVHPDDYYREMLESFSDDHLKLYVAKYQGRVISAALVSFFGGVATYLHGVSGNENRNVMAPFAIQWQAICDAKSKGCERYDFGGTNILKDGSFEKSWAGISRFKRGFCPKCELVEFPGCWDVILDKKKYFAYQILQKVRDCMVKVKKNLR